MHTQDITKSRCTSQTKRKRAFTTDQGLYCYIVMPFGLKNAGATYQCLVNKMFARQIGKNMEVYVDMLTKSVTADKHVDDLRETFDVLTRYGMKLNPAKCVFGVLSGRFLGYQVHQRGIEVNPDKIQALAKMVSPKTLKDVQKLTGCLASLNRKKESKNRYTTQAKHCYQLRQDTRQREDGTRLITAARKLMPYFQAHKIRVHTNCPLKLILQKPEVSGRLTKWAIELSEFDVEYLPRTAIKGQAVADFVAEFTEPNMEVARMMVEQTKKTFRWQLRIDESSNTHGKGAGVVVSTPEGDSVECALRFDFKATNNQAEYEALIAGLRVCIVLGTDEVEIFSNSQVIVNQVLDEYQARDENMIAYLKLAKVLLGRFKEYMIIQIPREENGQADALAKLASTTINIWPITIPMIHLL
ncbi:hypothetical protein LWI29_010695 [Acer saccharum]|uniref:Retrovirus-related Pol polyprotein from transposon 17.6 n=1 Tax=Acer saccharum TaxID=4024 RepID=A0AA39TK64_ACESA|nr:hypothetical protein LWI29_010695 [Acer saccharum]